MGLFDDVVDLAGVETVLALEGGSVGGAISRRGGGCECLGISAGWSGTLCTISADIFGTVDGTFELLGQALSHFEMLIIRVF